MPTAKAPDLAALRANAQAAAQALADAEASIPAPELMGAEEAAIIFAAAIKGEAPLEESLAKLEAGGVVGSMIDQLAQAVIDARGE